MRIGFYINAKIGDSVVALPALRAIKQFFPKNKFFIFTNEIGKNLYSPMNWIDGIFIYESLDQISNASLDYLISSNCDKKTITAFKNTNAKTIIHLSKAL